MVTVNVLDTDQYLAFIRETIAAGDYKAADTVNKLALHMQKITTTQYSKAARLIAAAFLATI